MEFGEECEANLLQYPENIYKEFFFLQTNYLIFLPWKVLLLFVFTHSLYKCVDWFIV